MARWFFDNFLPGYSALVSTHGWFVVVAGRHAPSSWEMADAEGKIVVYEGEVHDFGARYPSDEGWEDISPDTYEELQALLQRWGRQFLRDGREEAEKRCDTLVT